MASIDTYLAKIREAVYGEEVRGSIHDAIQAINNEVINSDNVHLRNSIASNYSSSRAYAVDEYVFYPDNGVLYRCITAIPSPGEAWNSSHWTAVALSDEVDDLKSALRYRVSGTNKTIADYIFDGDLFSEGTITNGQIYRIDQHQYANGWSGYATCRINVEPGKTYRVTGYNKASYHSAMGYVVVNIANQRINDGQIIGDFTMTAPENAVSLTITFMIDEQNSMNIYSVNRIDELEEKIEADAAVTNEKIDRIENTIKNDVFVKNIFNDATIVEGRAYRVASGVFQTIDGYGTAEFPCSEGDRFRIVGFSRSLDPFGYLVNSTSGSKLTADLITGDFDITIPANAGKLVISFELADADNIKIHNLNAFSELFTAVDDLQEQIPYITALKTKRVVIKDFADKINPGGYDYVAFAGGIAYRGMQVFAVRAAYEHIARASGWGEVLIYYSTDGETLNRIKLDVNNLDLGGELRDINLSKTRDGAFLLLSGCAYNLNGNFKSYMFVLDETFNVMHTIQIGTSGMFVWGNTIQRPDGYLLKTCYVSVDNAQQVVLFKSNKTVSEGFNGMTFAEIHRFNAPSILNEATLTYAKDKLVLISRADGYNGMVFETDDLTGETGWGEGYRLSEEIQAPAALPYYDSYTIQFLANSIISRSPVIRYPAMIWYDLVTHTIKHTAYVDDTLTGAGGYPGFVKLGENDYRVMYYDDDGNNSATALYYKKFNPYLDGNIEYLNA